MRKKEEGEEEAAAGLDPWVPLPIVLPVPASASGQSVPRARRSGELAFTPHDLTPAQPSPRPASPARGCKKGNPPHAQSEQERGTLHAPQAWAPPPQSCKSQVGGMRGSRGLRQGSPGASGAGAQFLTVRSPQRGSKQHERNPRARGGGSRTSETPFRPHRVQY